MCLSKLESFLASRSERFYFIVLLALACAFIFPGLGSRGLNSLQELRVAQVAREMIENSDYIRPHYLGSYRFQKPPLAYWVCAASYNAFGRVDEFSARFPFALISLFGVVVFFRFIASAWGGRCAFLSALALLSFNEYISHARSCRIDNLLVFCLLCSAFLFYKGRKDKKHWLYIMAWAAAGFAFLAKGLAAVLFCAVMFPLVFVFSRDWAGLKKFLLWSIPGFMVFALISSSWYIAMLVFDPQAWTIMRLELSVLVDSSRHANYFFYYCYQFFGALFPGFAFFVPAVVILRKKLKDCQLISFLFVWFCVFFIVLSLMTNKQAHYCLLLAVPVAGMVGWFVDRLIAGAALPRWTMRWTDVMFYISTVAVVLAVPVANISFAYGYGSYAPFSWWLVFALCFVSAAAAFLYFQKILMPAFVCMFISSLIIFSPLESNLKFQGVPDTSLKTFCAEVENIVPKDRRVFHSYPLSAYVAFYFKNEPGVFTSADELKMLLKEQGSLYVIYNSMEPMEEYDFVVSKELLKEKFSHKNKFYYLVKLRLKNPN